MKSPKHLLAALCLASAALAVPSLASAGVSVNIGVAPPHYHHVRPFVHHGYVQYGHVYRHGWQHGRPGYRAEAWHRFGEHRNHRGWHRSHGPRHGHGHR
ncbi:MAG TPA: hypothetical protein VD885_00725 [Methylophilaceae bacterium]|nr:hypothetical protein [Methylophilaceae bacterium]